MNSQEKKYVIKRITDIENKKYTEAHKASTNPAITSSVEEKLERLKKGDYTVHPERARGNIYWHQAIDFGDIYQTIDNDKHNKLRANIKAEADALRDQVMLGNDNDELLKMINDFNNMEIK